ncbi:MAG: phosphatidylserine/phosphatidylglycerophosphate/cardiolipin synthase family protein [Verrucomicrobia bacterium]|nr:phosphatidylserine/phosphatidylglycerophosphate/cardiolipin synthase family protein [Verrucomicrobiota bacterium]
MTDRNKHRLAPPSAVSGIHHFTWHGTGQSLLNAKLEAIAAAKVSVCLEVFTFSDSEIGNRFREALAAAARCGVRVRLIVDVVGSFGLRRDNFADITDAGGEMRWFNKLRFASFSFRDHRKLLVIDDALAFVGGCNIAMEYFGDGITAGWRDGGISVRGPVVALLGAEFGRQWERAHAQRWTFPPGGVRRAAAAACDSEVEALFIKPGFGRNPLREALRRDLATATDVAITTAYFLPTRRIRRQLAQAVANGARVRLLLAGESDVRMMQLASRSLYRRLLRAGIGIWEYQPQVLHAKLIVIDDVVYVGSSNLDPRSLRINFEIMLRIKDAALVAAARQQFEADLARHSTPVTSETFRTGRSWWVRLRQRLAYWLFARLDPELAALKLHRWHGRKDRLLRRIKRSRGTDRPTAP